MKGERSGRCWCILKVEPSGIPKGFDVGWERREQSGILA
jgi:hypothetical protein